MMASRIRRVCGNPPSMLTHARTGAMKMSLSSQARDRNRAALAGFFTVARGLTGITDPGLNERIYAWSRSATRCWPMSPARGSSWEHQGRCRHSRNRGALRRSAAQTQGYGRWRLLARSFASPGSAR